MTRTELPSKIAGETLVITFNFTSRLEAGETISTKSVAAAVYSGTDASPSAVVSGAATSSGAIVSQAITAGIEGVVYKLTCTITTSASQTLLMTGYLAVVPELP